MSTFKELIYVNSMLCSCIWLNIFNGCERSVKNTFETSLVIFTIMPNSTLFSQLPEKFLMPGMLSDMKLPPALASFYSFLDYSVAHS